MSVLNGTVDILTDLQKRVAALEQQAGGSDSLQPNVLTVAADGTIGANFTGHVHAQGVDLDAATSATPPSADVVRWLRTDTGGLVAQIQAYYTGPAGASSTSLLVHSQGTTDAGTVTLRAIDDTGATQASLQLNQINRGAMPNPLVTGTNTEIDVFLAGGAQANRLLGADGSSHYLQQPSATNLKLEAGTGTFVGNGTSSVNPTAALNTNLASIVATAACPVPSPTWGGYLSCVNAAPTALQFAANTNGSFANGTTYHFLWIAIG